MDNIVENYYRVKYIKFHNNVVYMDDCVCGKLILASSVNKWKMTKKIEGR